MHKEVLSKKQKELLPLIKDFSNDFGLVGGTAIAILMGHRESIDFDLFTKKPFDSQKISNKIRKKEEIEQVVVDSKDEFTLVVKGVMVTFLFYPYKIEFEERFEDIIKIPNILTLGAMKAYTLGRRAKWKDYVDLYFITKEYNGISEITEKAKELFGKEFNEKIFRAQLAYFEDIDFSEKVIYVKGSEIEEDIIKEWLQKVSVS